MKCPKCGSENITEYSSPITGEISGRYCHVCFKFWSDWQQAEIERLQKEVEQWKLTAKEEGLDK